MFPFYILTICKSEYICIAVNKKKSVFFGSRHTCVLISGNFSKAELLSDL